MRARRQLELRLQIHSSYPVLDTPGLMRLRFHGLAPRTPLEVLAAQSTCSRGGELRRRVPVTDGINADRFSAPALRDAGARLSAALAEPTFGRVLQRLLENTRAAGAPKRGRVVLELPVFDRVHNGATASLGRVGR